MKKLRCPRCGSTRITEVGSITAYYPIVGINCNKVDRNGRVHCSLEYEEPIFDTSGYDPHDYECYCEKCYAAWSMEIRDGVIYHHMLEGGPITPIGIDELEGT